MSYVVLLVYKCSKSILPTKVKSKTKNSKTLNQQQQHLPVSLRGGCKVTEQFAVAQCFATTRWDPPPPRPPIPPSNPPTDRSYDYDIRTKLVVLSTTDASYDRRSSSSSFGATRKEKLSEWRDWGGLNPKSSYMGNFFWYDDFSLCAKRLCMGFLISGTRAVLTFLQKSVFGRGSYLRN